MRYLPLTPAERAEMLGVIGAATVDDLFVDVPAEARLSGPVANLPMHASEPSSAGSLAEMRETPNSA